MIVLVGVNDMVRAVRGISLVVNTAATPLWARSDIYNGIRIALKTRASRRAGMEETPTGSAYPIRRKQRQDGRLVDELRELGPALAGYRQNLRAIIDQTTITRLVAKPPSAHIRANGSNMLAAIWTVRAAGKFLVRARNSRLAAVMPT